MEPGPGRRIVFRTEIKKAAFKDASTHPVRLSGGMMVVWLLVDALRRLGHDAIALVDQEPPDWVPAGAEWRVLDGDPAPELRDADAVIVGAWNAEEAVAAGAKRVGQLIAGNDLELWPGARPEIEAIFALPTRKLAIADHLRRELTRDPGGEVTTIGCPIDLGAFHPRRIPSLRRRVPRVLSVGADVEGMFAPKPFKGIAEQVEIVTRARDAGDRFEFVRMAPRRDRWMDAPVVDEALIGFDLGRGPSRGWGWEQHRRNVADVYRSCDLYLSFSSPLEGLGIPAIEAACSGVPAVLPRIPSYAEIPELEQCALFFEPGDLEEALHHVRALLADRDLRRRLGAAGPRQGFASCFDPVAVARRMLGALLGDGERAGAPRERQPA